jgi:hypothetical protein
MFYLILKHAHSGFRWIVLIFIVYAIFNALRKLTLRSGFEPQDRKVNVMAMSFLHIQFLIGLILYFISPKVQFSGDSMGIRLLRFYLVEHIGLMFMAVTLLTIGHIISKKINKPQKQHRRILIYYSLSLILILIAIPWPWMNLNGAWF